MVTRKRVLRIASGLLALIALGLSLIKLRGDRKLAAARARFETEIGPLEVASYAPEELRDEENAAFWLRKGGAALQLSDTERKIMTEGLASASLPPSGELEDMLTRQAPALASMHRAGGLASSSWGIAYNAAPTQDLSEDFLAPLLSAKMLVLDARSGLAAVDQDRLLANARALAALRKALETEPHLVFQLLAMSVEKSTYALAQDTLLSDLGNDPEVLKEVAATLPEEAATSPLRKAFAMDAVRSMTFFDPSAETEMMDLGWLERLVMTFQGPFERAAFLDVYRRLGRATELPASEIESFIRHGGEPDAPITGIIAQMLIPNLIDSVKKDRSALASGRLARIAFTLRAHALVHGSYPESLDGFSPADLQDPYAEGTIHFERHADGSASLSYPEAEALWREENQHVPVFPPRFVWQLPS